MKLDSRYEQVMKFVEKAGPEYEEELFGGTMIVRASQYYFDSVQIPDDMLSVWYDLPLKERGRVLASRQISNMKEVVERHDDIQKRKRKEAVENSK